MSLVKSLPILSLFRNVSLYSLVRPANRAPFKIMFHSLINRNIWPHKVWWVTCLLKRSSREKKDKWIKGVIWNSAGVSIAAQARYVKVWYTALLSVCVLCFTTIQSKHDDLDLPVTFGQFGGYKPLSSLPGRLCYPSSSLCKLEQSSFHCNMGLGLVCIPALDVMTVRKKVCIRVLQASLV